MLGFNKLFKTKMKKKIARSISVSLYEDYLKTCKYTGELPLSKAEYEKRFYEKYEEDD